MPKSKSKSKLLTRKSQKKTRKNKVHRGGNKQNNNGFIQQQVPQVEIRNIQPPVLNLLRNRMLIERVKNHHGNERWNAIVQQGQGAIDLAVQQFLYDHPPFGGIQQRQIN